MLELIITHKVKNFPEWKEMCDAGKPFLRQAGITSIIGAKRLVKQQSPKCKFKGGMEA